VQFNPYLNFNGNCEAAFKYYQKVLGGKIEAMIPFEGSPAAEHSSPEMRKKIMHARLIVDGQPLMGSDCPPEHFQPMQGMSVALNVAEPAEADRVFHALAEKGTVQMPIEETFWAHRFGMLVDQFGTPWMINCEKKMA
jgi:PhnB protein